MKNIFKSIGLLTLICVSFIYTEKTINVAKEIDEIMIKIKEEAPNFKQEGTDAVIVGDTIIPGISGSVVDEDKSYAKLKEIGHYNSSLLEYKRVPPKVSIVNNYDKYIVSGNLTKKQVSLILILDEDSLLKEALTILEDNKANFFVNSLWLEENSDDLLKIINAGHVVGNLSYNGDYNHSDFIWMDTIFKRAGGQEIGYCLAIEENEEYLKTCATHKNYTIKPSILNNRTPIIDLKEQLKNGSVIALNINNRTVKDLPLIVKHINSKGYKMVNLNEIITE